MNKKKINLDKRDNDDEDLGTRNAKSSNEIS
jgi:hypothetical protein